MISRNLMDIEKSCICVFKGLKKFLTQVVSTGSYYLSTLDVNQSQDLPQVLLRHLSNYLRTVPPIHPLYSSQIDHPVPAPCSYECLVSFHYCPIPCCIAYLTYRLNRNFQAAYWFCFNCWLLTHNFCKKVKKESHLIVNFAKLNSLQTHFISVIAKLKTPEMCRENFREI